MKVGVKTGCQLPDTGEGPHNKEKPYREGEPGVPWGGPGAQRHIGRPAGGALPVFGSTFIPAIRSGKSGRACRPGQRLGPFDGAGIVLPRRSQKAFLYHLHFKPILDASQGKSAERNSWLRLAET